MQVGFLNPVSYAGNPTATAWPVPPALCDREAVSETMRRAKEQLRLADELGFDWVSVSEHHYSPRIMTPSPMIYAGAITEVVKRAKIACSDRYCRCRIRCALPKSWRCWTR